VGDEDADGSAEGAKDGSARDRGTEDHDRVERESTLGEFGLEDALPEERGATGLHVSAIMGEQVALEVLGRRDGSPEEYASILAPIWESVLFGHEGQR
jgi:hypothetical protein